MGTKKGVPDYSGLNGVLGAGGTRGAVHRANWEPLVPIIPKGLPNLGGLWVLPEGPKKVLHPSLASAGMTGGFIGPKTGTFQKSLWLQRVRGPRSSFSFGPETILGLLFGDFFPHQAREDKDSAFGKGSTTGENFWRSRRGENGKTPENSPRKTSLLESMLFVAGEHPGVKNPFFFFPPGGFLGANKGGVFFWRKDNKFCASREFFQTFCGGRSSKTSSLGASFLGTHTNVCERGLGSPPGENLGAAAARSKFFPRGPKREKNVVLLCAPGV